MARIVRVARVAGHEHLLSVAQVFGAGRDSAARRILNRARPAPPLPPVSVTVFVPALLVLDGLPNVIERNARGSPRGGRGGRPASRSRWRRCGRRRPRCRRGPPQPPFQKQLVKVLDRRWPGRLLKIVQSADQFVRLLHAGAIPHQRSDGANLRLGRPVVPQHFASGISRKRINQLVRLLHAGAIPHHQRNLDALSLARGVRFGRGPSSSARGPRRGPSFSIAWFPTGRGFPFVLLVAECPAADEPHRDTNTTGNNERDWH